MASDGGTGWTRDFCDRVHEEYLRFLTLAKYNPEKVLVPSKAIDAFWHRHIIDTLRYEGDCDQALGRFLHHCPHAGTRDDADRESHRQAWQDTLALYQQHFQMPPPEDVWRATSNPSGDPVDCGVANVQTA